MIVSGIEEEYKKYLTKHDTRWKFGNHILYSMCEEYPLHNDIDIIVGKIWLIGRSYAAAIERRKNAISSNDDFYYYEVAPKMLEIGKELDNRITQLKNFENQILDNIQNIMSTHKFLMEAFNKITGLEKRSLASKYLHFHCPCMFFIFDSRAKDGINKIVTKPTDRYIQSKNNYDKEYSVFVNKIVELQNYLGNILGYYPTPRELDNFLLQYDTNS